jgi:hypothetical protein
MNKINCNDPVIIESVQRMLSGRVTWPMDRAYISLVEEACRMCKETKLSLEEIKAEIMEKGQKWSVNRDILMELLNNIVKPLCSH